MRPLQLVLRLIAIVSIMLVIVQLVAAARSIESPDNDAIRLAGLGLPLLFLAFLNLIVWSQSSPRRNARLYTHFANGLLLVASLLVMHAIPVSFAFSVGVCTALLAAISLIFEFGLHNSSGVPTD